MRGNQRLQGRLGEGTAINDGYPSGYLEAEEFASQRNIQLPVSEAIFHLNSARLANLDAGKFPRSRIHLQENLRGIPVRRMALCFLWEAAKDGVAGWDFFLRDHIDLAAEARKIRLPGEERKRRAQVGTLLNRGFGHSVIVGNVKPGGLAIDEKELLFRRIIFPAHLPRTPKVHHAGFDSRLFLPFAVAFQENSLQGARLPVMLFQKMRQRFCRRRGFRREGGLKSTQDAETTAKNHSRSKSRSESGNHAKSVAVGGSGNYQSGPMGLGMNLLERTVRCSGRCGIVFPNHCRLVRVEMPRASIVRDEGIGVYGITGGVSLCVRRHDQIRELISTFLAGRQHFVDQLRICLSHKWAVAAKTRKVRRKSDCISRRVNYVRRRDVAKILDRSRFIRAHFGFHEIRYGDGRYDQNDGNHDEQFDQRESLRRRILSPVCRVLRIVFHGLASRTNCSRPSLLLRLLPYVKKRGRNRFASSPRRPNLSTV